MTRNFISREAALAIVKKYNIPALEKEIEAMFSFPAPNPTEADGRNIMGQTEDEFWAAVESQS